VSALTTSIELLIEKLRPWWKYGRSLRWRKSNEMRKYGQTWTERQSPSLRAPWKTHQFLTVRTFDMLLTGQKLRVNFRLSNTCQKPQILYVICTWCLGTLFRNLTRHSKCPKIPKRKIGKMIYHLRSSCISLNFPCAHCFPRSSTVGRRNKCLSDKSTQFYSVTELALLWRLYTDSGIEVEFLLPMQLPP